MQVELNTIASSFGALSAVVSRMHEYTASRSGRSDMVRPCPCPVSHTRVLQTCKQMVQHMQQTAAVVLLFLLVRLCI